MSNLTEMMVIDEEIGDEMDKINFWTLSENEAQSLGISIGILNETMSEERRAIDSYKRGNYLNVSIAVIVVLGLAVQLSVMAIAIGVAAALLGHSVINKVGVGMTKSMVATHRKVLLEEIKHLREEHPPSVAGDAIVGEIEPDDDDADEGEEGDE